MVTVTVPQGAKLTMAEAMKAAKTKIRLEDLGISDLRFRKAITGALVMEVQGEGRDEKADNLAKNIKEVLADTEAVIARPVKTAELRVMDLDESVTPEDVADAIARVGECSALSIKVGEIRMSSSRLGTAWVRCPLDVAHKLGTSKRLRVGWVSARVAALEARPLQCFKCLEKGHVRNKCPNDTKDRSQLCYICGESGHRARECTANNPRCPVCADLGLPADHRVGSKKCSPPKKKKGGAAGATAATVTTSSPMPVTSGSSQPDQVPEEVVMEA